MAILLCLGDCETPSASSAGLTGSWLYRSSAETVQIVLKEDGTYRVRTSTEAGSETVEGRYFVQGQILVGVPAGGEPEHFPYSLSDTGTLILSLPFDGELQQVEFVRHHGEAPSGAGQFPGGRAAPGETVPARLEAGRALGEAPLLLRRYRDTSENAFTILVPDGWLVEGGMVRVDPSAAGGAAQSIEAKLDLQIASDAQHSVSLRWFPHVYYADMRYSPAAAAFPTGANYGGMRVMPVMSAGQYILQVMLPSLRPQGRELRVVEQKSLAELATLYRQGAALLGMGRFNIRFDAALISCEYREAGRQYKEVLVAVVEDRGQAFAGMWCNRFSFAARAPLAEFARWAPVIQLITDSPEVDPNWLAGELRGQITRGGTAAATQRQVQEIGRAIAEHRRQTNALIARDMQLTLLEQEEFVNPFSGRVETGTNQYQHRWTNEQGDILYTDDEGYDPNADPRMHATGFKRSRVRPRVVQ